MNRSAGEGVFVGYQASKTGSRAAAPEDRPRSPPRPPPAKPIHRNRKPRPHNHNRRPTPPTAPRSRQRIHSLLDERSQPASQSQVTHQPLGPLIRTLSSQLSHHRSQLALRSRPLTPPSDPAFSPRLLIWSSHLAFSRWRSLVGALFLALSFWRSDLILWPNTNLLPGALPWRSLTGSVQAATCPGRAALGLARSESEIPSQPNRGSTWRPHRNPLNLALSARHVSKVGHSFELAPSGLTVAQQPVALTQAPFAPHVRGVAPIGPFAGWPRLDVTKIAPIGPPAATLTGGDSHGWRLSRVATLVGGDSRGWPHSGYNLGGGPNRAARGDLLLAITCWRSLTGALRRARSSDPFRGWPTLGLRTRGVAPTWPGRTFAGATLTGGPIRAAWGVAPTGPLAATAPWQSHVGAL